MASTCRPGSSSQGPGQGRTETRAGAEPAAKATRLGATALRLPGPPEPGPGPGPLPAASSPCTGRGRGPVLTPSPPQASLPAQQPPTWGRSTFPSSKWSLVGGLAVGAQRDPERPDTPPGPAASSRVGASFETKRSASFGVETFIRGSHSLVQRSSNLTHIGPHPPSLDSLRTPTTTPNLKPPGLGPQDTAGGLVRTHGPTGNP